MSKEEKNYWAPYAIILEAMPRFQKAIMEVRKRLDIPDTGIPYENRAERFSAFFINTDEDLLKRYGGSYWPEGLLPANKELLDELDNLRIEFNLDPRWLQPLFLYIFSGDKPLEPPPQKNAWISARFNDIRLPKEQQRVTSLSIQIEKDTTIHDIRAIWDDVKKYQAYMDAEIPSRRDLIKKETVDRYCQVIKLRAKGLKYQEIARKFPNKFISAEDVRSFKNKIESRFKKRTSLRNLPNLWWHN